MGWIEVLQDKVSSLYSNVTVVRSEDEKRIEELVYRLRKGLILNITRNRAMDKLWIAKGSKYVKEVDLKTGKEENIEIDAFTDSPLDTFLEKHIKNSILILSKFLNIPDGIQETLIAIARDTELMSDNIHIILFTENPLKDLLLESVKVVNVPLSTEEERRELIESFEKEIGKKFEDGLFDDRDAIIRATSGLNLIQFESLLYESAVKFKIKRNEIIPASWFAEKKVELLNRAEYFTLSTPTHGLEAFASPEVIKNYIEKRIIKVIKEYDRAKKIGMRYPDGLLLFGMQGTGKTWLARAIAKEINVPFVEFSISSILSKYVGESEKKVERLIKVLEAIQPAVLFMDEIDALAPRRESIQGDAGVTRKILNRLMSWMADERKEVLVIGSTNRPQDMDEAFLRAGRFSHKIPLLLPNHETRAKIFQIHLNLRKSCHKDIDYNELADRSEYFTGADIVKVIDDALFNVFINNRDCLTMEDFDIAFEDSVINLERNKQLQETYLELAKGYGTSKKIVEVYTTKFRTKSKEKIELLKEFVKG